MNDFINESSALHIILRYDFNWYFINEYARRAGLFGMDGDFLLEDKALLLEMIDEMGPLQRKIAGIT